MADVKPPGRQRSAATRLRLLRAAEREFSDKGYHGATMASIAQRAGVAGQTVYFVFHTKAALMSALIDLLVMGEELPIVPQESDWWAAMREAPTATEALEHFIRGAGALFARASRMSEIMRFATVDDPELRATYESHERLRDAGFREVVEVIASKGRLRAGLTVGTATDLLMVMFGDGTYYQMTVERGWSHEQLVDWLCEALPRLLLFEAD